MCLHLGSAFLWKLDRGCGLNEIGHSFLCNKSLVHIPHGERDQVILSGYNTTIKYKANEMRSRG